MNSFIFKKRVYIPIVLLLALIGLIAIFYGYHRFANTNEKVCAQQNGQSEFERKLCMSASPNSIDCGTKDFRYPGQRLEQPTDEDQCAINALEQRQPFRFRRITWGTDDYRSEGITMNQKGEVFFLVNYWSMGHESDVEITRCYEITLYMTDMGQYMYCTGTFRP